MTQVVSIPNKDDDEEAKQYHRKKLYELSKKSLGKIPQSETLNNEQQDWIKRAKRWYRR